MVEGNAGLKNAGFTRQPLSKEFCARRRLCHHEPPLLIPGRLPNIGRIRHPPIQFCGFLFHVNVASTLSERRL